jgi:hypothetical protein
LLNRDASRVKASLEKLEREPGAMLARAGLPPEVTNDFEAGPSWRGALQQFYSAPDLEDEALETLAAEIVAQADRSSAIRRRWLLLQELALLLLVALGVAGLIIVADSIGSDIIAPEAATPTPPPSTVVVTRIVMQATAPAILDGPHATPLPTRYPTPSPVGPPLRLPQLSESSSPLSILERLRIADTFWETVQAEMVTVFYGLPGYLGPNRIQRTQFWLSADQARIQSGPPEGPPDKLWVGNRGRLYAVLSGDGYFRPPELIGTGSLKHPTVGALDLIFNPLRRAASEPAFGGNGQLRVVGSERIAGRDAIIVELLDVSGVRYSQLWLDTRTSFVLRHQLFHRSGATRPAIESTITWIDLDQNFTNQSLFDIENPRAGDFANAPIGKSNRVLPTLVAQANPEDHPQPALIAPPADFNPASSVLSFLYPPDFDLHAPDITVEVFAEKYHLGSVTFANPWWMICERSPDGRRVAAVSHPVLAPRSSPAVYVLDLIDIGAHIQRNLPIANVSELAFSPDSRRLALLSKGDTDDFLYLADLETDELRLLTILNKAHSLMWSPTGDQLLLISEVRRLPGEEDFVIFDAATGDQIRDASYDPAGLPNGSTSQGEGPGTWYDNSPQNGGLEACAAPPAQTRIP